MLGGIPNVLGTLGMGGVGGTYRQENHNPSAPAQAEASFDVLTDGYGMDVGATMQKHSDFATQYQRNAVAEPYGPSGGIFGGM